jgi:tetratricopeptide (TPR) repeat protein
MRALLLLLLVASFPALAQQQTVSATKRAPSPPGFDAAFDKGDYQGAFILIADAVVACVKAQTVQDECLDLLLVATNTASRAGALEPAETLASEAARVAEAALPDTDSDRLIAVRNLAGILDRRGKPADALPWHRKALALADRQLKPDAPAIGTALAAISAQLQAAKDWPAVEAAERRLLAWREAAQPQNVPTSHSDLALALRQQGKRDAAEAEYAIAQRLFAARIGADHAYTLAVIWSRAENLEGAGRPKDALALVAGLAARQPPDTDALRWLGRLQLVTGDYAGSQASYTRAVDLLRAAAKPDAALIGDSLGGISAALDARGREQEAEAAAREALRILPATETERRLRLLNNIAGSVLGQGRYAEAQALFVEVVALRRGGDPRELATALSNLSLAYLYDGRHADAAAAQGEAMRLRLAHLPDNHPDAALSRSILADIAEDRNGPVAALALRQAAYDAYAAASGVDHPLTARAAQMLALSLAYAKQDYPRVQALLTQARHVMLRLDPESYDRISNASYLATALTGPDQLPQARALLRESAAGIAGRIARMRDFDAKAQREMRRFKPIFTGQVATAWMLSKGS